MGLMFAFAPCFGCGTVFGFNPDLVPSIPIDDAGQVAADGVRQPVCAACVEAANPLRVANGLPPIVTLPGAYEPGPEGGL
jgi:hypothetical protein